MSTFWTPSAASSTIRARTTDPYAADLELDRSSSTARSSRDNRTTNGDRRDTANLQQAAHHRLTPLYLSAGPLVDLLNQGRHVGGPLFVLVIEGQGVGPPVVEHKARVKFGGVSCHHGVVHQLGGGDASQE